MALKWLGNTGSHQGQIQRDDLLDAFEILEHVLGELIERWTAKVAQLAAAVEEEARSCPKVAKTRTLSGRRVAAQPV